LRCRRVPGLASVLGLAVGALFLLWEMRNAAGVTYSHWGLLGKGAGDDYDEGAYVVSAQLLLKGYPLFHAVFSAQPALFLPSLALVVRLVPDPIVAGHLYEALCGFLALAGVLLLGWSAYRPLAGVLAAGLLAVSPGFLLYAHAVESEMPMLAFCVFAVAAAQGYYVTRRRGLAALSGLSLVIGAEMKLLAVIVALPLGLLLLGGLWRGYRAGRSPRALAADVAAFALALAAPALLILALLSPADQLAQVVTFHLAASRVLTLRLDDNARALQVFLGYDPGLLLVAVGGGLLGLGFARGERRYLTLVYALWTLSSLVFLWRYHPLIQHQFVPLLPPLALLGAALLGTREPAPNTVPHTSRRGTAAFAVPTVPTLALVVYLGLLFARTLQIDNHIFISSVTPNRDRLARLLDTATRPGDFVATDDPMVALTARRLLAPGLEDPSMVRIAAGYLTSAEAIQASQRYHVAAVVASRPKIIAGRLRGSIYSFYLPDYLAWAARHARRVPVSIPATRVYLRR